MEPNESLIKRIKALLALSDPEKNPNEQGRRDGEMIPLNPGVHGRSNKQIQ